MPYNKHNYRVTVPKRSGFDKSHRNSGTLTCGTLTPLLCDEVIPNSRLSLKLNLATQLPPLVSDTYMNVKLKAEAFFVPLRLCCGSFEDFFCDTAKDFLKVSSGQFATDSAKMVVPNLTFSVSGSGYSASAFHDAVVENLGPGTLADYLGCRLTHLADGDDAIFSLNILPLIAYHLIYQEWYRNPRVQKPAFVPGHRLASANQPPIMTMPYSKYLSTENYNFTKAAIGVAGSAPVAGGLRLNDGKTIFDLRQRNFPLDYFTGARVTPTQGDVASVSIVVPSTTVSEGETAATSTSFTIQALRAANSLQTFRERNMLPSDRLVDQVKARYGANLSDGVAQRPICIGTATYDIASTGISQTGGVSDGANPFNSVASQYGRAYGSGSDFIIHDFTANEPGYIIVLISMVPEVTYSSLVDRKFLRYLTDSSITDMATPLLQNVGDQPIRCGEITGVLSSDNADHIFGYQDRYSDFMFIPNQCHGKFVEGQSLSSFVLQRFVDGGESGIVDQSSDFLTIPTSYFDGVFAASTGVSGVSAWFDSYLDYKVSMPLAEFSIPSLQDPAYEHGYSVSLRRNGQIF